MTRHTAARLGLAAVTAVTLLLGIGTVGRAAWLDRNPAAIATMAVLLGLFAVAAVVWGRSLPPSNATLQTTEFVITGLPPEAPVELTTRLPRVGAPWTEGDTIERWPSAADGADALNAFVAGDGALITAGEVTERLFTHEFTPSSGIGMDQEIQLRNSAQTAGRALRYVHDGGAGSVHVLDLLRREGFDGGVGHER